MTSNKVAVVTAAAGAGIGAAIAKRLASDGFDVVITDAHARRAEQLASELTEQHGREFTWSHLDVTDPAAVSDTMDRVATERGGLHVLVNNAGWSKIEPVAEMADIAALGRRLFVDALRRPRAFVLGQAGGPRRNAGEGFKRNHEIKYRPRRLRCHDPDKV